MENWITQFMEQFGYLSVFLLITIENIFPPIPSEIILTFGGFMTTYTKLTAVGVIAFATAGSVVGAIILYGIGKLISVEKIERIVAKWGHILGVKTTDITMADSWFKKYGYLTVFFCRMVPIVRSLISLPAGMSNMNFLFFLLYTTIGTLIWNIILVTAGAYLGSSWPTILKYFEIYHDIALVIFAIIGVAVVGLWFLRKRKNSAK